MRVRLATDVFTRRQTHHRQLNVPASIQDGAERIVRQRRALDVANPSEHPNLASRRCSHERPHRQLIPIHTLDHLQAVEQRAAPAYLASHPTTPGMKG